MKPCILCLLSLASALAVEIPTAPPAEFAGKLSPHRSPLRFEDGREVKTPADWKERRQEILRTWHGIMGAWPPLNATPVMDKLETSRRENFTQHRIRLHFAPDRTGDGYLLIPEALRPLMDGTERIERV